MIITFKSTENMDRMVELLKSVGIVIDVEDGNQQEKKQFKVPRETEDYKVVATQRKIIDIPKSPLQKKYDPEEMKKAFDKDRVFWNFYLRGMRNTSYEQGRFDTCMQMLKDEVIDYEEVAKYLEKSSETVEELYHLWTRMSSEIKKGDTHNENPN